MAVIIMILSTIFLFQRNAWAQEFSFPHRDIDKVIVEAKTNNKGIFLYCHTSWCIPCKEIERTIFSDSSFLIEINRNYIPISYNTEIGDGIRIAKKFRVSSFPTIIILDSNFQVHYRTDRVPYKPDQFRSFLQETVTALKASSTIANGISGTIDLSFPKFYNDYFSVRTKGGVDSSIVFKYLEAQSDLYSEVNWSVISILASAPKYDEFIIGNYRKLKELYGQEVYEKLRILFNKYRLQYIQTKDAIGFQRLLNAMIGASSSPDSIKLKDSLILSIRFYEKTRTSWDAYLSLVRQYNNKFSKPSCLNFWQQIMNDCTPSVVNSFFLHEISPMLEQINAPLDLFAFGILLKRNCQLSLAQEYIKKAVSQISSDEKEKLLSIIRDTEVSKCSNCN